MTLYATYNSTTMRIISYVQSNMPPNLTDHPELAFRAMDADPPAFAPAGHMFDGNFAVVPCPVSLDALKAAKCDAASAYLAARIAGGFTFGGTRFQIDAASQSQITAMGALAVGSIADPAGSPWAAGFYWVAADNSHVSMDAAVTYAFARAVALYVGGCILHLRTIKDTITGAADEAALDAIDVAAGYPAASG
jgi:hypothetical protein